MFRRLIIAAALALPLAGFAGGSSLIPVAHALVFPFPPQANYCEISYPVEGPPYSLDCPNGPFAPGEFNIGGTSNINWTGTAGSHIGFPCDVPSIVNGTIWGTDTSSEIDVEISPQDNTIRISEWCQVQTEDHPGTNLFAYLSPNSVCYSEGLDDFSYAGEPDNNFFVTENATGLATLRCNFDEPFFICGSGIVSSVTFKPSCLDTPAVTESAPIRRGAE